MKNVESSQVGRAGAANPCLAEADDGAIQGYPDQTIGLSRDPGLPTPPFMRLSRLLVLAGCCLMLANLSSEAADKKIVLIAGGPKPWGRRT